jgi:tRNA threonylcarbamoyladenosine biosynthesis protein TsaB
VALILAIDTTAPPGSLALYDGTTCFERLLPGEARGFGEILFVEIEALLAERGLTLHDIDCFAAACGPGTFTGVRTGLTAAMGLAEAADKQVVAVSNLAALARLGSGDFRAPYLDARRGQIYAAIYDATGTLHDAEVLTTLDAWHAQLPPTLLPFTQTAPLAAAVALIALHQFTTGNAKDPAQVDANYIRRNDAQQMWHDD